MLDPDFYDLNPEQLGLAVADYLVKRLGAFIHDRDVSIHWCVDTERGGEITARVEVKDREDE